MYTSYFNLKEKPFKLTPDPKYLYLGDHSSKAKSTIAEMLYTVKEDVGFAIVIGEVGTGKTTVCRTFVNHINQMTDRFQLAYIFNPNFDDMEIYPVINNELQVENHGSTRSELYNDLIDHLLKQRQSGKTVILVIDEAQNLSPTTLEQVRLLSNLETETKKLIQIILVGQPELSSLLESHSMRQLNQRISVRCYLNTLTFRETKEYIRHRLRVAGGEHLINIFTPPALLYIYLFSGGKPRLINIACDRSLLATYATNSYKINFSVARRCIRETSGFYGKKPWFTMRGGLAMALALVFGFTSFFLIFNNDLSMAKIKGWKTKIEKMVYDTGTKTTAKKILGATKDKKSHSTATAINPPVKHAKRKSITAGELFFGSNSRNNAMNRVFTSWSVNNKVEPYETKDLIEKIVMNRHLRCYTKNLSLEKLIQINYPAILEVRFGKGQVGYMSIIKRDNGRFFVDNDGKIAVSKNWIEKYWTGKTYIVWREYKTTPEFLQKGDTGESVVWLQEGLNRLGYLKFKPVGFFEGKTYNAVVHFQSDYQLKPSGVVDPLTRMYIYRLLNEYGTPKISEIS